MSRLQGQEGCLEGGLARWTPIRLGWLGDSERTAGSINTAGGDATALGVFGPDRKSAERTGGGGQRTGK